MNIIELMKEVGITSPDGFKLTVNPVQLEKQQAFANAVIAAHTEELIAGVGEPDGYRIGKDGECEDVYTATQVAAAVAIGKYALNADRYARERRIAELEALCDKTYVASGADAYNHACSEMERWQKQRLQAGKEVGTQGSLCDGIAWLYGRIAELESTLKVALEALTTTDQFSYETWMRVSGDRAISKINEVLHD